MFYFFSDSNFFLSSENEEILVLFYEPYLKDFWTRLNTGLCIISLAVYAIICYRYLLSENKEGDTKKITDFFEIRDFGIFFLLAVILFLFTIQSFHVQELADGAGYDIENLYMQYGFFITETKSQFTRWVLSLYLLVGAYLPYIFALALFVFRYKSRLKREKWLLFRKSLPVILFFAAIFYTTANYIVYWILETLYNLIHIIYNHPLQLAVLSFVIYTVFISWLLPVFAGIFIYPVIHSEKSIEGTAIEEK